MLRKLLMATALVAVVAVMAGSVVWADSHAQSSQAQVPVSGQAVVIQAEENSQIRVKAQATDASGWLVELALNPTGVVQGRGNRNLIVNLDGTYTLGTAQKPLSKGTATGQLDQGRNLRVQLSDPKNSVSLQMSLSVDQNGNVTGEMDGTLPAIPATVSPVSTLSTQTVAAAPASHTFWYISRTAALISYLLLFFNVCLGLGMRARVIDKVLSRWRVFDLHQFTALSAVAFLCLHVFSLLGDQYFSFGIKDLLVPFASPYRAIWTALGVFSFYVVLVVTGSFYVRNFLGAKTWRAIHYATFLFFSVVLLHGIKSGTDTSAAWGRWLYILTGTTTAILFLWRFWGTGASQESAPARGRATPALETVALPEDRE